MGYKELIDRLIKRSKADESGNSFATICSREDLKSAATAINDLLARVEAAEARAEKAEREKYEAISDLETIMAYGEADLDTCEFCKNGQCYERGGTKPCLPKWRGQKEE